MPRQNPKNIKADAIKLLKKIDEAVGAETPTRYNAGYIDGVLDYAKELDIDIKPEEWRADAMRKEVGNETFL